MREMSRSASVSLAHRYWNFDWSESRNRATYGDFASPIGIGSNLRLELTGTHEPDLELGLRAMKQLIDHRALFEDVAQFARRPSTLEVITTYLNAHLRGEDGDAGRFTRLTVFEDDRRWCSVNVADDPSTLTVSERICNLTLSWRGPIDDGSGLAAPRARGRSAVRRILPAFADAYAGEPAAWARALFTALRADLPDLFELHVELGPNSSLRVSEHDDGTRLPNPIKETK